MSAVEPKAPISREKKALIKRRRAPRRATSLSAHGEPLVWLTGGAMAISLLMIVGLLALVVYEGGSTFWPKEVVRVETVGGKAWMGEVAVTEQFAPSADVLDRLSPGAAVIAREHLAAHDGHAERRMLRTGNFDLTGSHYTWISAFEVRAESKPEWAVVAERMAWGRLYGKPTTFTIGEDVVARTANEVWGKFREFHAACRARFDQRRELEREAIGAVNRELEDERLALKKIELSRGKSSPAYAARKLDLDRREVELQADFDEITDQIRALNAENARYQISFETADGAETTVQVADIVRAYPANQLGFFGKLGVYFSRWAEFLTDAPREANSEGGVFPAIFGTVVMTLVMSLLVVPFGVLAALYLREYAKQGFLVSLVRIAVNNLAGVPSIVFGVFGLGFFCYIVGASIDQVLFSAKLPNPTFGKGGLLWASLTLALLTLPVVIVATEEALSSVPGSMREGSYACGATKWQTIQRIVLPRALPGIMTGMILAIARGAGEVAPLMLVGASKLAPGLAVDGVYPFVHPERSFMHLGFHIYDLGFQSQNSEAAKPMVYTTTLLLIAIIVVLNVTAVMVRGRLRKRFAGGQF